MLPSKIYLTLAHFLTLACVLNQHFVLSDIWERHPSDTQICPQDLIVKHFVRKLLSGLPDLRYATDNSEEIPKKIDYQLYFELSVKEQKILDQFVNSHVNFDDVVDVLAHMIKDIKPVTNDSIDSTEYFSDPVLMYFLISTTVVVATTLLFSLFTRRKIWKLVILTFFINVMWNWFYLYEEEKAKTLHASEKGLPPGCSVNKKPFGIQLLEWFTIKTDDCQKYIALMTINPFFRVRPYEALSISVTNIIFRPFEYCGQYLSTFIREICAPLPFYMQPIIITLLLLMLVVVILIFRGYTFYSPLLCISVNNNSNTKSNDNEVLDKLLKKFDELENTISTQNQVEDVAALLRKYIKNSEHLKLLNGGNEDLMIKSGGDH